MRCQVCGDTNHNAFACPGWYVEENTMSECNIVKVSVIINLTQHSRTVEQECAGVRDLPEEKRKLLTSLLTFASMPTRKEILAAAACIAEMAIESGATKALIGGAPWFMADLENALHKRGVLPTYSFSERVSSEEVQEDGSVRKVNSFRHVGFLDAPYRPGPCYTI